VEKIQLDRLRGIAVGAVVGDALGMPLEFHPARPIYELVTEMAAGPLPAGSFTDDTEMSLALAE
jgi:ADP-ribosyl-[dinitrogen reductase] hydrolase